MIASPAEPHMTADVLVIGSGAGLPRYHSAAGTTSVAESRNETPQPLSLEMYSGLKTRSQALSGIGVLPSAAFTLSILMPTVV